MKPPDTSNVKTIRDLAYRNGSKADPVRHHLDLYLPKGKKDFPVVVLFHGGAWIMGDNRCCGLYDSVGEFLASQGIGVVLPNYRLSPGVKHPEHVKDAARALAWVREHIGEYGGDPKRLFLAGHSAGGHLAALLATDERYLKAEGMKLADIRGVLTFSGVYEIPAGNVEGIVGGQKPAAFHWNAIIPLRGDVGDEWHWPPGLPVSINVFGPMFGDDPKVRADASPINHVHSGVPSFLIFSGAKDLPTLPEGAQKFHKALESQKCNARLVHVENRNHNSILFRAVNAEDPVAREIIDFIRH